MSEQNSYDLRLADFAGKQIAAVEVENWRGRGDRVDRITFRFKCGTALAYETEGDCCSQSWIEHFSAPDDIQGAEVTAIDDVKIKEQWDKGENELFQFYETRFKTTRGEIVLEYRNSSNGYYGGCLRAVDPEPEKPRKLTYFDRKPMNAITADQVRLNKELTIDACEHEGKICCDAKRLRWVLEQLQKHPGVSSSAGAVIEAALE